MKGLKVVTSEEMARIEKNAYAQGCSESEFMENAGKAIAEIVKNYLLTEQLEKKVTLLVGKGNNGGDSYVAGRILIKKVFPLSLIILILLKSAAAFVVSRVKNLRKTAALSLQKPIFKALFSMVL